MNQLAVETSNSIDIGENLSLTIIVCIVAMCFAFAVWTRNSPGGPESIRAEADLKKAEEHAKLVEKQYEEYKFKDDPRNDPPRPQK